LRSLFMIRQPPFYLTCLEIVPLHGHAGELLETLPPGVDEAVAISKVVQFVKSPEYSHFTRIIFDTAPTGHTLRLLILPDFLDATVGKPLLMRLLELSRTSTNVWIGVPLQ
jgi:anion-transporting  ArsA/GET3 family ATPase